MLINDTETFLLIKDIHFLSRQRRNCPLTVDWLISFHYYSTERSFKGVLEGYWRKNGGYLFEPIQALVLSHVESSFASLIDPPSQSSCTQSNYWACRYLTAVSCIQNMPADQSGSILPTVRYPSFLKSTRPYPRWHKIVHHTYVFIFFILVVALPITHATTKKHRPTSWELWTIFGSLLGAYILYRVCVGVYPKDILWCHQWQFCGLTFFIFRHGFILCTREDTIQDQLSSRDHRATQRLRCHLLQIDTLL
jgi:hypothetical protein